MALINYNVVEKKIRVTLYKGWARVQGERVTVMRRTTLLIEIVTIHTELSGEYFISKPRDRYARIVSVDIIIRLTGFIIYRLRDELP